MMGSSDRSGSPWRVARTVVAVPARGGRQRLTQAQALTIGRCPERRAGGLFGPCDGDTPIQERASCPVGVIDTHEALAGSLTTPQGPELRALLNLKVNPLATGSLQDGTVCAPLFSSRPVTRWLTWNRVGVFAAHKPRQAHPLSRCRLRAFVGMGQRSWPTPSVTFSL